MDLTKYGTSNIFKWSHSYLVKVLTRGKNRILDQRLIKAIKLVDRVDFVRESDKEIAHQDKELDIGYGQNISGPIVTIKMIELLKVKLGSRVLEIGTGSGYTAVILALMTGEDGTVFTVENQQYLIEDAKSNIEKYERIKNVEIFFKDGFNGLPERAPFDSVFVGFTVDHIPLTLKKQMSIGGTLVTPVKGYHILKITRIAQDKWDEVLYDGYISANLNRGIH